MTDIAIHPVLSEYTNALVSPEVWKARAFCLDIVPGLLQTEPVARQYVDVDSDRYSSDQLDAYAARRIAEQERILGQDMTRHSGRHLQLICSFGEWALDHIESENLEAQLEHILELTAPDESGRSRVEVELIRRDQVNRDTLVGECVDYFGAGGEADTYHYMYRSGPDGDVAFIGQRDGTVKIDDPTDPIQDGVWGLVCEVVPDNAESPKASRDYLAGMLAGLRLARRTLTTS